MRAFGDAIVRFFSSYLLAIVILVLLMLLTFLGTYEQRYRSIYDVQKDYFESVIVVSRTLGATAEDPQGGFPIPLPGAYLLLGILGINLIVGGIVRIRKSKSTVGVLIVHVGILVLLLGGMVEYHRSTKGSVALYPGQKSDAYQSYHDWDVYVTEYNPDGKGLAYVIPQERFDDLDVGERARAESPALPISVELYGYQRNSVPIPSEGDVGVDGFMLQQLAPANPSERNVPGVYVTVTEANGTQHQGLLWGFENGSFRVDVDDREFGLKIAKRQWELPFAIRLKRFVKEEHARTSMAREYSSYVQKFEDGAVQDIHITMNEPLRHRGYTFYQSSFIENAQIGATASVFSVVKNPADRIPEFAFYVIGLGLVIHFTMKLVRYIKSESRRQAHAA